MECESEEIRSSEVKRSRGRETWSQILAISVNNFPIFTNGMIAGYRTILIPGLLVDQNDKIAITEYEISWIVSISFMTSILGCFMSGLVTQPIGRVRSLHISCPLLFGSFLLFKIATEVWHIYAALSLCGWLTAVLESALLSYKSEVCQPRLRSMLSASGTLTSILGVLFQFVLGTLVHWRTVALISSAVPAVAFVLFFFIPESPYWLIMQNKIDKAKRSLAWLRGWTTVENVEDEFQSMLNNYRETTSHTIQVSNKNRKRVWKRRFSNYAKKSFLWPLALVSFISFLSNFGGLSTLQTYAVAIFGTLRAPMDNYYATITLGIAQCSGCVTSLFLLKFLGKRKTAFASVLGVAVCNIVVGIYALLTKVKYLILDAEVLHIEKGEHSWIPTIFLIGMAFVDHAGIRVLPWILFSEVFSHETRAAGCGIGSGIYFLFSFLANKIFLTLIFYLEFSGVHWLYAGICILGAIVMYFSLPETEDKELQEIINHFSGVSRLGKEIGSQKTKNFKCSSSDLNVSTAEELL